MPHVFISYSRKDTEFVQKLEQDLNTRGISTWRDSHSIAGGQQWYESIVKGIKDAYVMVQILTVNAEQSRWVKREAFYADKQGLRVIPVLPAPYVSIYFDFLLIETQPILCDDTHYMPGLTDLVRLLESLDKTTPSAKATFTPTIDREHERAYLDFVLGEAQADLVTALYVNLSATRQAAPKRGLLPNKRRPKFDRLGIEKVHGEEVDQVGEPVEDARIPIHEMKRALLLGEPGEGKTTTLLQLTIDMAHAAQKDSEQPLPVFIPLRSFQGQTEDGHPQTFAEFVRQHFGILQDQADALRNRVVLLCDALNEMQRKAADGRDLVAEVRAYLEKQPRWVVSCRVRDYREELSSLPDLGKVRLQPLTLPRIYEVIQKRFHDNPARAASLWEKLHGSDELLKAWELFEPKIVLEAFWEREWPRAALGELYGNYWAYRAWRNMHDDSRRMMLLCRNPYMLYLVYEIFDTTGKLPDNRGELFATFVDDLIERERLNSSAIGAAWIDESILRPKLAQLAYQMQISETGTEITKTQALAELHDVDGELLLRLAAAASLLQVGETVRFTHQLLQEYFASEVMGAVMDKNLPATQFWPEAN